MAAWLILPLILGTHVDLSGSLASFKTTLSPSQPQQRKLRSASANQKSRQYGSQVSHVTGETARSKMETMGEGREAHISCLFPEILAMIFTFLEVRDKGRAAQVCTTWRDAAYNRMVWRGVEAKLHLRRANPSLFPSLVKRGIKRVQILSLRRSLRDVITGIPNLESLNMSGCYNVTDNCLAHAFIVELPNLVILNLSLCKLVTDISLGRIAQNLKNLETLELGGCCKITSHGLVCIALGLKNLKTLNLRSCRHVSDQGIGQLAGSTSGHGTLGLRTLILQDCQKLTDTSLKYISEGLPNLHSLNLSFCGSVTDTGLRSLAKMPSLRELNLRSCDNVSDIGVGFLADGGSRVNALDVSFCERIGDQSLSKVSQGLFHMHSLSLSACRITDEGLKRVARTLHQIQVLNIGQCSQVTDRGLQQIGDHMRTLRSIDLYGCTNITTVGMERIMQLPNLHTLNLGLWHKR